MNFPLAIHITLELIQTLFRALWDEKSITIMLLNASKSLSIISVCPSEKLLTQMTVDSFLMSFFTHHPVKNVLPLIPDRGDYFYLLQAQNKIYLLKKVFSTAPIKWTSASYLFLFLSLFFPFLHIIFVSLC